MLEEILEKLKSNRSLKLAYELVVSLMRFGYFLDNSDLAKKSLDLKISLERKYNIVTPDGLYKPENLKTGNINEEDVILIERLIMENCSYLVSHGYEFISEE